MPVGSAIESLSSARRDGASTLPASFLPHLEIGFGVVSKACSTGWTARPTYQPSYRQRWPTINSSRFILTPMGTAALAAYW